MRPPSTDRTGSATSHSGFLAAAGLQIDELTATRVVGHIDLGPNHHTPWGIVHGGVSPAPSKAPPAWVPALPSRTRDWWRSG